MKRQRRKNDPETHRLIMQSFDVFADRLKKYPKKKDHATDHIVLSFQAAARHLLDLYDAANDDGDFFTLRAEKPKGFFMRLRWARLDESDASFLARLRYVLTGDLP